MRFDNLTREKMWARQQIAAPDVDYAVWERGKQRLSRMPELNPACTFVVDVYRGRYAYASPGFADLFGYDRHKIATLENQGDYLESRIHPDDLSQLHRLQVELGQFIYTLPAGRRNDYCNIYSFRMRNAKQQYVRVTSRHRVLEQDRNGKAWLIIGQTDMAPDQREQGPVHCTVMNHRNGELFSPASLTASAVCLTQRETEVLQLIRNGFLSKEIAGKLCISIHTVNIHRQNLLRKLGAQNAMEAVSRGIETGVLTR